MTLAIQNTQKQIHCWCKLTFTTTAK